MALLYLTLVFNGVCSFFFGRVCQYDLNEVRGFASDIRWASLFGSLRPGLFENLDCTTKNVAEFWAIYRGLMLAWDLGYKQVIRL
ncbi:hypothetical protein RND71_035274 [Anisodus tanguticus]|uniref:RNase H type-1 domain-containing protein n=1 Tax=Anisodus tanguticus TaxID=243964 RepID=A0AAE1UUB8_9SOLA|nr:hypothetical protein RND71_035274 [Anisodus tanguticus]